MKECLGQKVVFRKLRMIFQKKGLTRNLRLMRNRKEKINLGDWGYWTYDALSLTQQVPVLLVSFALLA